MRDLALINLRWLASKTKEDREAFLEIVDYAEKNHLLQELGEDGTGFFLRFPGYQGGPGDEDLLNSLERNYPNSKLVHRVINHVRSGNGMFYFPN